MPVTGSCPVHLGDAVDSDMAKDMKRDLSRPEALMTLVKSPAKVEGVGKLAEGALIARRRRMHPWMVGGQMLYRCHW